MKQIIYRSRLTDPRGASVVPEIVRSARMRNSIHGITGVLVFDGQSFCQHLEGDEAEVDHIFGAIRNDFRHTDLQILHEGPIRTRRYSVWSMAYGRSHEGAVIAAIAAADGEAVADELQDCLPTCDLEA